MNQSRFIHYDKRRLPREKRTISVFGAVSYIDGRPEKDQSNKLFRCWNCGFICNELHNNIKTGDGEGYYITDKPDTPSILNIGASAYEFPESDNTRDVSIGIERTSTAYLMMEDCMEEPVTVIHNNDSVVTSGCPFCGTKQYR